MSKPKPVAAKTKAAAVATSGDTPQLLADLRQLIEHARHAFLSLDTVSTLSRQLAWSTSWS
jgi:hypothetical protein